MIAQTENSIGGVRRERSLLTIESAKGKRTEKEVFHLGLEGMDGVLSKDKFCEEKLFPFLSKVHLFCPQI